MIVLCAVIRGIVNAVRAAQAQRTERAGNAVASRKTASGASERDNRRDPRSRARRARPRGQGRKRERVRRETRLRKRTTTHAPRRRTASAREAKRNIKMIIGSACCPIILYFYVCAKPNERSDEPAGTGVGGLERRRARSEQPLNRFHFL